MWSPHRKWTSWLACLSHCLMQSICCHRCFGICFIEKLRCLTACKRCSAEIRWEAKLWRFVLRCVFAFQILYEEKINGRGQHFLAVSLIIRVYFQIYGASYLQSLLEPLIKPLLDEPNTSFEVDTARLEPTEDIEQNRKDLIALTEKVFDAIINSADKFPPQLRSMCHCLYQVSLISVHTIFHSHNLAFIGTKNTKH